MPVNLTFAHELLYLIQQRRVPALQLGLERLGASSAIDITAHLDSGTERTLLDGTLAHAIGLVLLDGAQLDFYSATGARMGARVHRVKFSHDVLGDWEMEVGFSTGKITRNLLGLDFFNLFQICFHERQQRLLMNREP